METENYKVLYIYGLYDPRDNEIKYIGKSKHPKERLVEHIYEGRYMLCDCRKNRWVKELLENELKPYFQIIEEVNDFYGQEREKFWIRFYRDNGFELTNDTDGGDGLQYTDSEESKAVKKKISNTKQGHQDSIGIKRKSMNGKPTSSKYTGVSWSKDKKRWRAQLTHKGQRFRLGEFKSEKEAALAYNKKALELWGDKARLNIIEDDE
jgi:hypothetical protein